MRILGGNQNRPVCLYGGVFILNTNLKGNKLLRRTLSHSFPLSPTVFLGFSLLALISVFPINVPPAVAQSAGPFAEFTGS